MRKPVTRPSKPPQRGPKLIRPMLAEKIAILRGIAADPDARELKRGELRRMRPFSELKVALERKALHMAKHAAGTERSRLESSLEHASTGKLGDIGILTGTPDSRKKTVPR